MTDEHRGRSWSALPLVVLTAAVVQAGRLDNLQILQEAYPRAFFFRQCEGLAAQARTSYGRWERTFSRLMGIEGKALDEEVIGRQGRNPTFFSRFKTEHRGQLVLLHFNGNARDPRWQAGRFFAGHWLYYNGARITRDVAPQAGRTTIHVENAALFRTGVGRYRDRNEDIGLCELGADGRPDWHRSEQVRLVAVDVRAGTIRVERGCYDTRPRAFKAGRAYAAAHVTEGPWGTKNNLMWFYNYSTCSPRDHQGRTCADRLVDHLAELLGEGGPLAEFDGLEFDVLRSRLRPTRGNRGPDCDADGKPDAGMIDGLNTYGIGVVEFCRQLRRRLGEDRLILADGASENNQRAFGILNGIESEGWPHLSDPEVLDFSGGFNRHSFWGSRARKPALNYVNHKYTAPGEKPGQRIIPRVPYATHRLVLAAAVLTDSAVCYSYPPPREPDGLLGIWDELRAGTDKRPGYLGRPLGPAVRLAKTRPDLLESAGSPITEALLGRFESTGAAASIEDGRLKVTANHPGAGQLSFTLKDIPSRGPELTVFVTARAEPMEGYPPEYARLMHVAVRAGRNLGRADRHMTWVDGEDFESAFYFPQIKAARTDLEFTIEGSAPVEISEIRAFAGPDAAYRPFDGGVVLANPSWRPYTFDLPRLLPGRAFRRLRGSPRQDPAVNNGEPVTGPVELPAKDGLFLVDRPGADCTGGAAGPLLPAGQKNRAEVWRNEGSFIPQPKILLTADTTHGAEGSRSTAKTGAGMANPRR